MICTVSVFDESIEGFPSDSSALAAVFNRLPTMLKNGVVNPMDEDETIYPRDMSEEERKDIIVKTILAGDKLISALKGVFINLCQFIKMNALAFRSEHDNDTII